MSGPNNASVPTFVQTSQVFFKKKDDAPEYSFLKPLLKNESYERALHTAGSRYNTSIRLQGNNAFSKEEEARLRMYEEASERQQEGGPWRAIDVAPPLDKLRPFPSGRGYHRKPWTGRETLKRTYDIFEELKPHTSPAETDYHKRLCAKVQKSKGNMSHLAQLLTQRLTALNIELSAPRRSLLLRVAQVLHVSNVPPYMYEDEIKALIAIESIGLENTEATYKATAPLGETSAKEDELLYETIVKQMERYRIATPRKQGDSAGYFSGTARDVFRHGSAVELIREHRKQPLRKNNGNKGRNNNGNNNNNRKRKSDDGDANPKKKKRKRRNNRKNKNQSDRPNQKGRDQARGRENAGASDPKQ